MNDIERAVVALRALWPTLGHPDHWSGAEADSTLIRIAQTVLAAASDESI